MHRREQGIEWMVATMILAIVLLANDPTVWLAGAVEGLFHAVPVLGSLFHHLQTAIMGV